MLNPIKLIRLIEAHKEPLNVAAVQPAAETN